MVVKVTPGKVERVEETRITYRVSEMPELSIAVEKPYAVKAAGEVAGVEAYRLNKRGVPAQNTATASRMSFLDKIRAALQAFKGVAYEGGITPEDVTGVQEAVSEYNELLKQAKAIGEKSATTTTKTAVPPEELSDLLKEVKQ